MDSPSPEALAVVIGIGGGVLSVLAAYGLGCLLAFIRNRITERKVK